MSDYQPEIKSLKYTEWTAEQEMNDLRAQLAECEKRLSPDGFLMINCKMEGPAPLGFPSWSEWFDHVVETRVLSWVELRAIDATTLTQVNAESDIYTIQARLAECERERYEAQERCMQRGLKITELQSRLDNLQSLTALCAEIGESRAQKKLDRLIEGVEGIEQDCRTAAPLAEKFSGLACDNLLRTAGQLAHLIREARGEAHGDEAND